MSVLSASYYLIVEQMHRMRLFSAYGSGTIFQLYPSKSFPTCHGDAAGNHFSDEA